MRITKPSLALALAFAVLAACSASPGTSSALQVQPASVDVAPGGTVSFAAFENGTVPETVVWSVQEAGGGLVDDKGHYTAPATEGTYHVTATAMDHSSTVVVVVRPGAATNVTIRPTAASLATSSTLPFSALVNGSIAAVSWSVEEGAGGGSITDAGLYTAPQAPGTYHVVVRTADGSLSERATVTVVDAGTPPAGQQLYVSTGGNDSNPGTLASPWRTIQKAMNSAPAGSTVNIMAGTYSERLTMNVSGTASQPIVFQNYGYSHSGSGPGAHAAGDAVVVDLSFLGTVTSASVSALMVSSRSYVTIRGITFQNFTCLGGGPIFGARITRSHDITFRDNKILHFKNIGGTSGNSLANFYVDDGLGGSGGQTYNILVDSNEYGDIITTRSGENFSVCGAYNVTVTNNWVHDHDSIGMNASSEFYGPTHDVVFRGNLIEYVARHRDGSYWYSSSAGLPLFVDGAYNVIAEGNTIRNSQGGITVDAELGPPSHPAADNVIVRNNIVQNDTSKGIQLGTWYDLSGGANVHSASAYNNTIDNCATGILVLPHTGTVKVENNIITNATHGWSNPYGAQAALDYNLWYNNRDGNGAGAHDVFANPLYASPSTNDFSLKAGSPGIDVGDPGTTSTQAGSVDWLGHPRFGGGRIDIGADEAN